MLQLFDRCVACVHVVLRREVREFGPELCEERTRMQRDGRERCGDRGGGCQSVEQR